MFTYYYLLYSHLNPGHYTVEVFATRFTRAGERVWKGEKLYKDLVYFDGRGVTEIWVDGRDNMRPERPSRPEQENIVRDMVTTG